MSEQAPAGWFGDPGGSGRWRWWDGEHWTEQLGSWQRPAPLPTPKPPVEDQPSKIYLPPATEADVEGPPEAGWFRDPMGKALLRFWDGHRWTEQTS